MDSEKEIKKLIAENLGKPILIEIEKPLFQCSIVVHRFGIKKNNKAIFRNKATGRTFIGSNSKVQVLEKQLIHSLIRERLKNRTELINEPVNAEIIFNYPESVYWTKDKKVSNRVADVSNLYQIVEDSLQDAQIITNDKLIDSHDGSHRRPIPGVQYVLEIKLTRSKYKFQDKSL